MPRFFFDVNDGDAASDADGRELPDEEAARRHAMKLAAQITQSSEALEAEEATIIVTVRDTSHRTVATISLVMDVTRH